MNHEKTYLSSIESESVISKNGYPLYKYEDNPSKRHTQVFVQELVTILEMNDDLDVLDANIIDEYPQFIDLWVRNKVKKIEMIKRFNVFYKNEEIRNVKINKSDISIFVRNDNQKIDEVVLSVDEFIHTDDITLNGSNKAGDIISGDPRKIL